MTDPITIAAAVSAAILMAVGIGGMVWILVKPHPFQRPRTDDTNAKEPTQ